MKFFYNKIYKKLIILLIVLFCGFKFYDQIPYPLILDDSNFSNNKSEDIAYDKSLKGLPNACFKVESMSGNFLFGYASIFYITDYEHFRLTPGVYFGKEIDNFEEFNVLFDDSDTRYSLIQPLKKCRSKVNTNEDEVEDWTIIKKVSKDLCKKLSPNLGVRCIESYYIDVFSRPKYASYKGLNPSGYGIFGLFELEEEGLSILPLKYFRKYYDGLNSIWFSEIFD